MPRCQLVDDRKVRGVSHRRGFGFRPGGLEVSEEGFTPGRVHPGPGFRLSYRPAEPLQRVVEVAAGPRPYLVRCFGAEPEGRVLGGGTAPRLSL